MKLLSIKQFSQSYSFSLDEKPAEVWAIPVAREDGQLEALQGIPHSVLNKAEELSNSWCGWGFGIIGKDRAFLLFENKEDAIFAKIHIGENVNHDY